MLPRFGEEARREAVAVFDDANSLEAAIDELESNGFDRADITLLAGEEAVEAKLGHRYQRVEELEDDPEAPRTTFVSTEARGDAEAALIGGLMYVGATAAAGAVLMSGGTLALGIGAATLAGGTGGLIGTVLAALIGEHHAKHIQQQLDHGGLLLWVRTVDTKHEGRACDILRKHSAREVHVHEVTLSSADTKG